MNQEELLKMLKEQFPNLEWKAPRNLLLIPSIVLQKGWVDDGSRSVICQVQGTELTIIIMMEPTSEDAPWCFMISGEREHVTRGGGTAKSLDDLIVLLRSSLLDYANLVVKAASKSSSKVELNERPGFYFDETPRPNTLLESINNLEIRLVRCVELMALQYMTDDEGHLLPVDQETSGLDLQCLTFLAAVGSVTQLSGGSFVWTGKADFITLPEYRPPLLEAPEWSLQDRITLLKDLARKYLGGLIDNTMTHDFMCAGEQTLALLAEVGICKLVNGSSVFYEFVEENISMAVL